MRCSALGCVAPDRTRGFGYNRIACWCRRTLLAALLATTWASSARPALAEPAVEATNAGLSLFYSLGRREDDTSKGFIAREIDQQAGGVAGSITLPVSELFGLRVNASTAARSVDVDGLRRRTSGSYGGGVELFARDPEMGLAGVRAGGFSDGGTEATVYGAGIVLVRYFAESRLEEIDLGASFDYARRRADVFGSTLDSDSYAWSVGLLYYLSDNLALGLGGLASREEVDSGFDRDSRLAAAQARSEWLISPRFSVAVNGEIGSFRMDSGATRFSGLHYRAGVSLILNFSGAKTLIDLNRRFR